jgi:nitrate/nitrite transporter NarK
MEDRLHEGGENTASLALLIAPVGSLLLTGSHQFELSFPGVILLGVGMGVCNAAVFRMAPQAAPQAIGGATGGVGGLGALGGFVLPPVMAFAVRNLGTQGYAIGFVAFVFLTLFSLWMTWILKYTHDAAPPGASRSRLDAPSPVVQSRQGGVLRMAPMMALLQPVARGGFLEGLPPGVARAVTGLEREVI